jgi:hypothetical protein
MEYLGAMQRSNEAKVQMLREESERRQNNIHDMRELLETQHQVLLSHFRYADQPRFGPNFQV